MACVDGYRIWDKGCFAFPGVDCSLLFLAFCNGLTGGCQNSYPLYDNRDTFNHCVIHSPRPRHLKKVEQIHVANSMVRKIDPLPQSSRLSNDLVLVSSPCSSPCSIILRIYRVTATSSLEPSADPLPRSLPTTTSNLDFSPRCPRHQVYSA